MQELHTRKVKSGHRASCLCHPTSKRRILSAESLGEWVAVRMVTKDCPESRTGNPQHHRCRTGPVLYMHIDHLALQPPDHIPGALPSAIFRTTSGRKRKKLSCCPLCHSHLISIYFATPDSVNPGTHRDNPVCILPSHTGKDSNWVRKRTCSQIQAV